MPKLPVVSGREVLRALKRAGFETVAIRGSHHMMRRPGRNETKVSVPVHGSQDMPPGTLRAVLETAGMSVEEFVGLL